MHGGAKLSNCNCILYGLYFYTVFVRALKHFNSTKALYFQLIKNVSLLMYRYIAYESIWMELKHLNCIGSVNTETTPI